MYSLILKNTSCWSIADQSPTYFNKFFAMQSLATDQRLIGDWSATTRKPLTLVGDPNQPWLDFCACPKYWRWLILINDRSATLLRPLLDLAATSATFCDCLFFSRREVASSVGLGLQADSLKGMLCVIIRITSLHKIYLYFMKDIFMPLDLWPELSFICNKLFIAKKVFKRFVFYQ